MKVDEQQQEAEKPPAEGEEATKPEGTAEPPKEGEQIQDKPKEEANQPKKRMKRSSTTKESKEPEEEDLRDIGYFPRPRGNEYLWNFLLPEGEENDDEQKKVTKITAAGNYCYALVENKNEVYSWGFGENYVLGNRDDVN